MRARQNGLFVSSGARLDPQGQHHPSTQQNARNRSDGKASFGYAQLRGRRASQEDAVAAQWSPLPPGAGGSGGGGGSSTTSSSGAGAGGGSNDGGGCSDVGLFAVFDGHGGPGAAEFASQHLLGYVLRSGAFATDPAAAMGALQPLQ